MPLDEWTNKRKLWSKARDAEKVSSGAVSGVNLGESIEKVGKAAPKGLKAIRAAIVKLLDSSKKYKAGMKKHPKLVKWIDDNVDKPAKVLDDECEDTINVLNATPKTIETALQKSLGAVLPFSNFITNFQEVAEKDKKDWYAVAKSDLDKYAAGAGILKTATTNLKDAAKFVKVEIPGKPSPKEGYEFFAEVFEGLQKAMAFLGSQKTRDGFSDAAGLVRRNGYWASHSDSQGQNQLVENAKKHATEQGAA